MRRFAIGYGLMVFASCMGAAQKYVPPPPPLTVDPCLAVANPLLPKDPSAKVQPVCPPPAVSAPKVPTTGGSTAADQFPFPGQAVPEVRPSSSPQFPYPGSEVPKGAAPGTGSVSDQFPYPGETAKSPDAVPEGDTKRYVPDAPASGGTEAPDSSSSSSSSSGSSEPPLADTDDGDSDTTHARSHGRRALPKVSAVSPEDRVSEDLDVAKFYSDRGNFQAAYLRAKDATKLMPEDAETHFALAQAAEKLKQKDEAAAEYALYLKLEPAGEKKAAAQRALSQLR